MSHAPDLRFLLPGQTSLPSVHMSAICSETCLGRTLFCYHQIDSRSVLVCAFITSDEKALLVFVEVNNKKETYLGGGSMKLLGSVPPSAKTATFLEGTLPHKVTVVQGWCQLRRPHRSKFSSLNSFQYSIWTSSGEKACYQIEQCQSSKSSSP